MIYKFKINGKDPVCLVCDESIKFRGDHGFKRCRSCKSYFHVPCLDFHFHDFDVVKNIYNLAEKIDGSSSYRKSLPFVLCLTFCSEYINKFQFSDLEIKMWETNMINSNLLDLGGNVYFEEKGGELNLILMSLIADGLVIRSVA